MSLPVNWMHEPLKRMNTENENTVFTPGREALDRIAELVSHYPEGQKKSALVPSLHIIQEENGGWLSTAAMDAMAAILGITPIEVYEVASFYSQFNMKPVGKHVLEVCRTGPCCLVGAERLLGYLENRLGIKDGETTADGMFTIKSVECLGGCGYGPVIQVGDDFKEHLSEEKIDALLDELIQNS
jgi:NADH-quinone oxidoreductase subunit E